MATRPKAAHRALPRLRRRQRLRPSNPYRPFCSERCKNMDFGAWASESFRVPDESPPDDLPFGDPKEQ
jgi:endogenous inhibitor of DNA gyrase (YacG/DUF329 family)